MSYMAGGRVRLLGAFPGREGEGLGLFIDDGAAPRVARIIDLPGVDPAAQTGLQLEIERAAEALHHPHIQASLGIGDVDGRASIAVEHADGETLAEILAVGGRLPPEVAARIVHDACVAIHFAHEEGQERGPILHGWLRPSHLLVCRSGVTLVSGFGAGLARSAADLLPWQSPEQVLGGPRAASRRSDVHGLGLVLHASLAGENPFEREPDPEVAMLSRAVPRLEPLGVPAALAGVVRRSLAVKPGERFGDARELAGAISGAVSGMASPADVAAWSESLFPAGMGMRVLRQRAVESAVAAATGVADRLPPAPRRSGTRALPNPPPARAATMARPAPEARSIPLPEPAPAPRIERRATPPTGFRPAPRNPPAAEVAPRPFPRPVPALAERPDDPFPGEFSLAAPPFPHAARRRDPLESIEIDVLLPDPPPPLRLPVRNTGGGVLPIGRLELGAAARAAAMPFERRRG
jgi:serine/threonine-protein kinase